MSDPGRVSGRRSPGQRIHALYRIFATHFRRRRMAKFLSLFGLKESDRIIDVGGTRFNWDLIAVRPAVLLVNLDGEPWQDGNLQGVRGDATRLDFPDNTFDIAYSNSVVEHVGTWSDQVAFAREIARMAPRYYVQTPNRWFAVEPHLLAPLLHFLPRRILRRLVRYCSIWGLVTKPSQGRVDEFLASIQLLSERELRTLFPDATIRRERFLGMTKSLIAMRL